MILTKTKICIKWTTIVVHGRIVSYAQINNSYWIALITLISSSVFLMTRTLDLNFVDIVGIRVEPLVHVPNIKKITIHKSIEGAPLKSTTSSLL